jgi:hypothetical protein
MAAMLGSNAVAGPVDVIETVRSDRLPQDCEVTKVPPERHRGGDGAATRSLCNGSRAALTPS